MASRYVLHEVCKGQYRFTLTSHKGQVLLTSGLYMDKDSALRKIQIIRHLARNSKNFDLLTAEDGGRYFVVVTRKGEALASSDTYPNAEGRQAAIDLVKGNTRGARFEDLTQEPGCKQEGPVPSGRFAGRLPEPQPLQAPSWAGSLRKPRGSRRRSQTGNVTSAEFVLSKDQDGTFIFVFQTASGQVLLTSGAYGDHDSALRHLHSARHMARKERNYELRSADEGGFYFVVKNRNKEVLGHSETYPDPESRRQGMILTRGCSHGARVENLVKGPRRERPSRSL